MNILRPDFPIKQSGPGATYEQVARLLREGRVQEARLKALAIESSHIREMAFVLIERSRPLAA